MSEQAFHAFLTAIKPILQIIDHSYKYTIFDPFNQPVYKLFYQFILTADNCVILT